jgi:hypothetical protein
MLNETLKSIAPATAKAIIVAELHESACDSQTDYFASTTKKVIALAWSNSTRDNFAEMRKAAATFSDTMHLGPGCDMYTASVVFAGDVLDPQTHRAYYAGDVSPWHSDLFANVPQSTHRSAGPFTTLAAVEVFVASQPMPNDVSLGGVVASFEWKISKTSIEHREKYAMGHGYYLSDGGRYSGWHIRKTGIDSWREMDITRLTSPEPLPPVPAAVAVPTVPTETAQPVSVMLNAEKQGIELRFSAKPAEAVRDNLKAHGWRWSRFSGCWYVKDSAAARAFAQTVVVNS